MAVLVALLWLGFLLPNTGRIVIDQMTAPPTPHIVGRVRDSLILIGIVAVPVSLIFVGASRRSQIEIPGWILLAVLIVMACMKGAGA